jgi:hypothetical protein
VRESRETDEVLVCMAQRLQSQLERQLTLVERLQENGRDESLADLAELRSSLRRSLRGSENLLVLGGAQQGPRVRGPRSVADVLTDARAGVEDPSRIGLGPAPGTAFAPRAVAGLVALVSELLTHGLTVSSTSGRVEVTSRRAEDGGVVIEVACDGTGPLAGEIDELNQRLGDRPIIDDIVGNRVGLFVAARLARRCGAGLRVQHPRTGMIATTGLTVGVHCPPDLLDTTGIPAPDAPRPWTREPVRGGHGPGGNGSNGNGAHGNGRYSTNGNGGANGNGIGRDDPLPTRSERPHRPDPLRDPLPARTSAQREPLPAAAPVSRPSVWDDEPVQAPTRSTGPDELFGPMTSTLRDRMLDAGPTPIYEAVASAWFVDPDTEQDGGPRAPAGAPTDWSTPSDAEWRAASERASRPEPPQASTAAGLPRRRPGTQMVAPPRHGSPAPLGGSTDREPERVRERLAVYQQGLERGRHRAGPDQ